MITFQASVTRPTRDKAKAEAFGHNGGMWYACRSVLTMNKLRLVLARTLLTGILVFMGLGASAQTAYYVRAGATGANNGSDWNNAYTALPSSLHRGATYYIAAGTYNAPTLGDAVSGTSVITITSATAANHGTDTGWISSYAGQALFMGELFVETGYYTFDGQTRGADWRSGYTLRFWNHSNQYGATVHLDASHITMRYVEVQGTTDWIDPNPNDESAGDNGIYTTMGGLSNFYFGYSYIHETGNTQFQMNAGTGDIFTCEYNYVYLDHTAHNANHDEAFSLTWSDTIIRHNVFQNINGTGVITYAAAVNINLSNWDIYVNLFYWDAAYAASSQGYMSDGIIAMLGEVMSGSFRVFNNTVANIPCHLFGHGPGGSVNMYVFNNLIYNCSDQGRPAGANNPPPSFTGTLYWDYQSYYSLGSGASANDSSAHAVVSSANPFVNSGAYNFQLAVATAAGTNLTAPYNVDMLGSSRGADGVWDRGAYEFGPPSTNPPVISAPSASGISDRSANLVWTTDKPATSAVQYGPTTSYGTTLSNSTLVSSHSVAISNLTANTTYHYLVKSADAAGHLATSSDLTFTTKAPDSTAPTVAVTNPVSGTVLAGFTALSATASDNTVVASVQFMVDGTLVGSPITAAPFVYLWNSASVANGSHNIQAKALDAAGNAATATAVSVQVQNVVTTGLVGYWTFDEGSGTSAGDSSSSADAATLANGAAWGAGVVGPAALAFDGVNASASAADVAAQELSGNLSIALWVKHTTLPAANSWMYYIEKGADTSENYALGAYSDSSGNTRLFFEFMDSTGASRYITQGTGLTLTAGAWTQVTVAFDHTNTKLSFYVNGQLANSVSVTQSLSGTTDPLVLGQQNIAGFSFTLNGLLDDVRLYNRAISASEVSSLAGMGNSRPPTPSGFHVVAAGP